MMPALESKRLRVLLLCEDPLESHLLRTLLRALPEPRPELLSADSSTSPLPDIARDCHHCFLALDYAGLPLEHSLQVLRRLAPRLHIHGVLGASTHYGDRLALAKAMRSGLDDVVAMEELSLASLGEMLRDQPQQAGSASTVFRPSTPAQSQPGSAAPDCSALESGSWRVTLGEQRARFDAETLRNLGYAAGQVGDGIGDWKSLIHPDDIDRLVQELQRVLDNCAPPYPVSYRLRTQRGDWLAVVSEEIALQLNPDGEPQAITGRFYRDLAATGPAPTEPGTELSAGLTAPQPAAATLHVDADAILQHCDTAIVVYRRDGAGAFRVSWCNAAAANLEQRDAHDMLAASAREISPSFDGFDIEDALTRVLDTGIAEVHEAMSVARSEQTHWRRIRLNRLSDITVLSEAEDISEQANARVSRRMQDELAQHVVRSFPQSALLVDEQGRIVHALSVANAAFGADNVAIEDSTLAQLLGVTAGEECLQQVLRTLNTGRIGSAVYCVGSEGGKKSLECFSSVLRGRPGMPQRVVLTAHDISQRVRETEELRASRDQFRAALRHMPLAFYLKDIEGRYQALNPAFESLFGVEEATLNGKTDFEVFPDQLAAEMHEEDRNLIERSEPLSMIRIVGQGAQRGPHYCFQFPWHGADGAILGSGGLWLAPSDIPAPLETRQSASVHDLTTGGGAARDEIDAATASVIGRVEDALTGSADHTELLRQLGQLVETTMQAQAMIHDVCRQDRAAPPAALTALTPLAQQILELERILLPAGVRLENQLESALPPAQCDPVVFHQIMLRAIRHARRALKPDSVLRIALRLSASGRRACLSCREGFEGNYVELVIEDSDSRISGRQIERLTSATPDESVDAAAVDDLAEIHSLSHAQGGHLQIHRTVPSGTSLHVFFRAAEPGEAPDDRDNLGSTVARFPRERAWHHKGT